MKTIFSLVLLAGLPFFGQAQSMDSHFGIKAGLNVATLDVKNGTDFNSKLGFHFGVLSHIHLSRYFAVQPEVVYSQQGGKDGSDRWKMNYINVPVLLQIMAGDGFRIETGPQLGIKTSAKIKTGDIEVDNNDVSTLDFSWPIGVSYLSSTGLGLDARYNIGISNVNDADFPKVHNRVFQVGLFYQFSGGGVTTTHTHHHSGR
ncbi:MAG TPA: porin family protein [Chitinophagaceae bacterium]